MAKTETVDSMNDWIRTIVREEISKYNSKQELPYDGIVTAIDSEGLVSVDLDFAILIGLKNCTGETLSDGSGGYYASHVRVYAVDNKLTDAYVGVKIGLDQAKI